MLLDSGLKLFDITGWVQLILNTVNSKFHLIRSFFEYLARFGKIFGKISCLKCMVDSNTVNLKFHQFEVNLTGI